MCRAFIFPKTNNWRDKLSQKSKETRKSTSFYHLLKSKEIKNL